MNKNFTKTFAEVKSIIKLIDERSPYLESKDCTFFRGIQFLAEMLTNPERSDNYNLFTGKNIING